MHHCEHFTNAEFFINNEINVNRKQFYNKIGALCGFFICEVRVYKFNTIYLIYLSFYM